MSDLVAERERLLGIYGARVAGLVGVSDDYPRRWRVWCRQLLNHGGVLVVPAKDPEPHLDELLASSAVFACAVRRRDGETNACHANVAGLWVDAAVAAISTGYALSDDDLWRQHSWGLDADGTVVETTSDRVSYVGITLTEVASLEFAMGNNPGHLKAALESREARGAQLRGLLRAAWAARNAG